MASTLPKIRYSYFDMVSGRGEAARLLLSIHNVPFEDNRIPRDQWPTAKAPLGSLPYIEVNGKEFSGSNNILRFVGKITNTYPTDLADQGRVDELLEAVEEINNRFYNSGAEPDVAKKMAMRKALNDETLPKWLGRLERIHERNGNALGGFFVGNSLTVADVKVAMLIRGLRSKAYDGIEPSVTEPFPRLMALARRVFEEERVAAYFKKVNAPTYL